jgi:hypothetical protein
MGESSVCHIYAPQNICTNFQPHWKKPLVVAGENDIRAAAQQGNSKAEDLGENISMPKNAPGREVPIDKPLGLTRPSRPPLSRPFPEAQGGRGLRHFVWGQDPIDGFVDPGLVFKRCRKFSSHDFPNEPLRAINALCSSLLSPYSSAESWTLYVDEKTMKINGVGQALKGVARHSRATGQRELTQEEEREVVRRSKSRWICVSLFPTNTLQISMLASSTIPAKSS